MGRRPDIARREELLDQIEKIILTEGFSELRMGDLAKRLHCSRTTLYQLAPSKDDLVVLVFSRLSERTLDRCSLAADACDSASEKIRAFFDLAHAAESETTDVFWRDALEWQPIVEYRAAAYRKGLERVRSYIEEGIEAGVFRKVNAEFIAYLGWVGSLAVRDREFLRETDLTPRDAMNQLGDFIISALEVT